MDTDKPCFWIECGQSSRETLKVSEGARRLGYHVGWGANPPPNAIPVGSVDFCEKFLGYSPKPDFYPEFLHSWMKRAYGWMAFGNVAGQDWFVKSAERYKAYPARIVRRGEQYPDGEFVFSEVVAFGQEWRYYVADGCVLATGWYDGDDDMEPAPNLSIDWPKGFCGAVDFGRLASGEMALVECQHPYACGWYGDDHEAFTMWLLEGWRYCTATASA